MENREVWSFFSGALGMDIGFEQAGLRPTVCIEIDPDCCETIRLNRPSTDILAVDVSNITGEIIREARAFKDDVFAVIGGPPCQSFCPGGKRAGLKDPRGNLIYEYLRLISEIRPCFFVLENVANLATAALRHRPISARPGKHWSLKLYERDGTGNFHDGNPLEPDERASSAIRQVLCDVNTLGYHVSFGVYDAADYGSPQHRLRFVMLGSRTGPPPKMPPASHGGTPGLAPFRTVRDAIWHLRQNPGIHSEYTAPVRELFSRVPPGGNWRSLPSDLHERALGGALSSGGGKTGFYRRLAWDSPAPTITGRANRKGSALCHPEDSRPLSIRECAALQGFPDDWRFCGSMNSQYRQVGNAVPTHLGAAIGQSIASADDSGLSWAQTPSLEQMLQDGLARLRSSARNKSAASKREYTTGSLFNET